MESVLLRCISVVGLGCMLGLAWLCSENRRRIPGRILLWGVALQVLLGILVLRTGFGRVFFLWVKQAFDLLTGAATAGASFLFGNLTRFFLIERALAPGPDGVPAVQENFAVNAVVAFNVLPVIIFVSGLSAILLHIGVIQALVRAMAWMMRRSLKTSGAETFGTAMLVFLGIECMSALGDYVKQMTRSELFTVMTAFLATIAASVMVAYAGFGAEPGHLLAASLMSAPAALLVAKIMVPETETPQTLAGGRFTLPRESENIFDAASRGAGLGLSMALHVGAMLIVFVGLIHLADRCSLFILGLPLTGLLGFAFRPFAWVMGVPAQDVALLAELLATKTVFNEFIAYQQLQPLIESGALSRRTITIATYALCGFANPGSLGILIGGLSAVAPDRRADIARLSLRAFIAGTLAAFSTACIAGILIRD